MAGTVDGNETVELAAAESEIDGDDEWDDWAVVTFTDWELTTLPALLLLMELDICSGPEAGICITCDLVTIESWSKTLTSSA